MFPTPFRSATDFVAFRDAILPERLEYERKIADAMRGKESLILKYYCEACGALRKMTVDWKHSFNNNMPNFRERLACTECKLNSRMRFMVGFVKRIAVADSRIYLYEKQTPLFKQLAKIYTNIEGSEFQGYDKQPGEMINGIRHEDALNMSFSDQSFDIIVSNEVFEHVPDIQITLSEAHRILRPGGKLLITVPFAGKEHTVQRAEMNNGQVKHLVEPQYHENPVDIHGGSLVFYDYGWDILEFCKNAGFKDAYMLAYYDREHGYLGSNPIFVAEKGLDPKKGFLKLFKGRQRSSI